VHAETRKLAAIMFTDIVGFSRQMGADEARMLRLLKVHNQIIQQAVQEHHGTVIKIMGDAFLVDFPSVVHAVQCAQYIQAQFRTHNTTKEPVEQIHVRIGLHEGDVVQREGDVFGDGVNVAARLQELAAPDMICISHKVYEEVDKKLALGMVVSLGRPKPKNIATRKPVYALLAEKPEGLRQKLRIQRLKLSHSMGTAHLIGAVAGLGLIVGAIAALQFSSLPSLSTQHPTLRTEAAPAALPLPDKPSIVVLPFANMSGDPAQEYFSDGITEELTAGLSQLSGLFVIARNSAFTYKGRAAKMQAVGQELGVRYVLEGSVRKADGRVRVIAQLIDATTGYHLWTERYDRELKDLLNLQDEITQQIVANLRVEVRQAELERVRRIPTENLTAYDYSLRGLELLLRTAIEPQKEVNEQAQQMFEKAIELDPTYAAAYVGLGTTYQQEWLWQWSQDPQTLERALALAQ
jgi:adenylate cyclase